jgi:hypothetical protein
MRQFALLFAAVFLLAVGTQAQGTPSFSLFSSPFGETNNRVNGDGFAAAPLSLSSASWRLPSSSPNLSLSVNPFGGNLSANNSQAPPDPAQGVYGVRPQYDLEAYIGYTYIRFYEIPSITLNTNGLNFSIQYYWSKDWLAADGEFVMTLGNQFPYQARLLAGLGGARVRMAPFRWNVIVWGHVLAGVTHFVPQTAYGGQQTFAYEVGIGADFNTHKQRYAFRAGADMFGSTFFGTYQLSPKISAGFVYRF